MAGDSAKGGASTVAGSCQGKGSASRDFHASRDNAADPYHPWEVDCLQIVHRSPNWDWVKVYLVVR